MEFVDKHVRVLAIANPQAVQGLQWYLDRHDFSKRRFRVFPHRLSASDSETPPHDLVWVALDLGQPVPVENLKRFRARPGIATFLQPTPQQLLQLAELDSYRPVAWDGVAYEKVALALDEVASRFEIRGRETFFLESFSRWLRQRRQTPGRLIFVNPPPGFPGGLEAPLLEAWRVIRIGGWRSKAQLRLPWDVGTDFVELSVRDRKWTYSALVEDPPVKGPPPGRPLESGDQIQVGPWTLQFQAEPLVDDLMSLVSRTGALSALGSCEPPTLEAAAPEDAIRNLLLAGATGEFRVQSGLKHSAIFLNEGRVVQSVTGAVSGLKALFRGLAWTDSQWKFIPRDEVGEVKKEIELGPTEFSRELAAWKPRWDRVRAFVPPPNLRLEVDPARIRARSEWKSSTYLVLAAVSEFHLVRDVFNNCSLLDIDIVETLIELKKTGLIGIQKSFEGRPQ